MGWKESSVMDEKLRSISYIVRRGWVILCNHVRWGGRGSRMGFVVSQVPKTEPGAPGGLAGHNCCEFRISLYTLSQFWPIEMGCLGLKSAPARPHDPTGSLRWKRPGPI